MKNKYIFIVLSLLILATLLSSCSSSKAVASWSGATVDGTDVFFTNSTTVQGLHITDGNGVAFWQYPEKGSAARSFYAAPVIYGDQVIIGDYSGTIVSIFKRDPTQTEYWSFTQAKGKFMDSVLIEDNIVIAPNSDGFIYFIPLLEGGSTGWYTGDVKTYPERDLDNRGIDKNALGAFWSTPATDGKTIFAASMDHKLYAIDIETQKLVWNEPADLGGPLVARPLLTEDGKIIYIGTLNGKFSAINASDGSELWSQTLSGGIWSQPVLNDGKLYIGDESGKITILDAEDNGRIIKSYDGTSAILGSGVIYNDTVMFGDETGQIISVKGDDTFAIQPYTLSGSIYSNLISDGTHLIALTTNGDKPIYLFNSDGTQPWVYTASK